MLVLITKMIWRVKVGIPRMCACNVTVPVVNVPESRHTLLIGLVALWPRDLAAQLSLSTQKINLELLRSKPDCDCKFVQFENSTAE